MGQLRLHRETFRDLGDGEEFDWIVAVTPATDMVEGSSRLISRVAAGVGSARVMPALISRRPWLGPRLVRRGRSIGQTRSMT